MNPGATAGKLISPMANSFDRPSNHPGLRQYPCSLAQERFWVLDRLQPGNPALNIAVRWQLEGEISVEGLERAFAGIIERHSVLRTGFAEHDGALVQAVHPQAMLAIPAIDLRALPADVATAESERLAADEARRPFDLDRPPLIRATLLRLADDRSVLLVTMHHIVADGWSVGLIAHEMGEIYAASEQGREPVLPELPIDYGTYAERLRAWHETAELDASVAFWRTALAGAKHFELEPDFPRPPEQTSNGAIVSLLLPRALTDSFAKLARRSGSTLFMASLATLFTLLHRYSGETDIAIGTQVVGRDDVDVENLVGLFINTLVLRSDLSGNPTFIDVLERVRDMVADAFEHQRLPLERLIEIVAPQRDLSRNALFSINFIFQRSFVHNESHGGLALVDMPSRSAGALYDLNFFMVERPDGWRLSCEYNTDLFEPATAQRLLDHFRNLMQAVIGEPDARLSGIAMLSVAEQRALVIEANDTRVGYPAHASVPQLVAEQAARTPDRLAISCGERRLTYRELDRASARLARHLVGKGIAGKLVGVLLDRSEALPVVLLGIMRAGCAYVPLDPDYPAERLAYIVKDAALSAIVSRRELVDHVDSDVPCLTLEAIEAAPDLPTVPLPTVGPEALAYVIYTSGSTGNPKGVKIPQRAYVNLLCAMRDKPGMVADDVLVAVTTISFDIAGLELFLPLIVGARLAVALPTQTGDGRELLALLRREGATVLQATPVTWQLLIEAGWTGEPRLKMLCGGEALPRRLANDLLARGGELWNMYGPTETTIWSSALKVEPGSEPVPLGGPIANTQFYVVDRNGALVPQGVRGELLIGGDGVAAGYHNMPAVTAARFLPDRFRPSHDAELYRTGDIVRMRRPGRFEYLGRADHQVKLRGFRIELGDVESGLLAVEEVAEAAAIVRADGNGGAMLVAYVVPRTDEAIEPNELVKRVRARLAATLPGYMQPQHISVLQSLPRTPNGKIDRGNLPPPVAVSASADAAEVLPLNEVERRLAAIWRTVLGVDDFNRHADFFELGGHSLLAARLLMRIEAEFGQKISLAALFKSSTFDGLARLLQQPKVRNHDFRQIVRLQSAGTKLPVIGINNTGIYFTLSKRLGTERSFTALQLFDPSFSRDQMPDSFTAIAEQYVTLIREVQPRGPYALLGWCVGGVLAFEVARQLAEAGEEISLLALIDSWAPHYIADLSPLRGMLADYSYRWQLIAQDWRHARAEPGGMKRFLANRVIFKRLGRLLGRQATDTAMSTGAQGRYVTAEGYDQWLLQHLQAAVRQYRPSHYAGKITIFASAEEPSGLFLDRKFGWQRYAGEEVEVVELPGDHFSIFTEPGVNLMAREITQRLDAHQAATSETAKQQRA